MAELKSSNVFGDLKVTGIVGIGGTPTAPHKLQIFCNNVIAIKLDKPTVDATAATTGKTAKGWLKITISGTGGTLDADNWIQLWQ
jgi:hypothetical protein